ncbi:MAG: SOS response-associated peptidase [Longimicrobiales bacterium]
MCGRFTLTVRPDALLRELGLEPADDFTAHYNVAPQQPVLAVAGTSDGGVRLGTLQWGLVPWWADDARIGSRMINARGESLGTRRAFREAVDRRRCLIIADGFYEWRREGGRKVPVRFVRPDGAPFTFAGLWERWQPPEGPPLHSCTIVTTPPNAAIAPIHDRMPLIIGPADRARWLDRDANGAAVADLIRPAADDLLVGHDVSTRVNSVANDDAACIEPYSPEQSSLPL